MLEIINTVTEMKNARRLVMAEDSHRELLGKWV